MTCIIGLEHKGKVYMSADSASSNSFTIRAATNPKLFRLGPFLIGFTSSWRMGQLLQHKLGNVAIQTADDDLTYLVSHFIEPVRTCLKDHGYTKVENNEETGGVCLVAFNTRIYTVQDDFSVLHDDGGLACVGSGAYHAHAAMLALEDMSPKKRIRQAMAIAARCVTTVAPPFHIQRL